jgi:hypothetical protein
LQLLSGSRSVAGIYQPVNLVAKTPGLNRDRNTW